MSKNDGRKETGCRKTTQGDFQQWESKSDIIDRENRDICSMTIGHEHDDIFHLKTMSFNKILIRRHLVPIKIL